MTNTDFGDTAQGGASGGSQDATPREMARQAVRAVRTEAASFADSAKGLASERIEHGRQTAGKTMGDFASAIRKAGEELQGREQGMAGQVVRKAADGLENVSRSITDKRPDEMLDTVRDFARQNPAAFIAGSVLLGIAIGRFAKSSQDRQESRRFENAGLGEDRAAAQGASAYPMPQDTLSETAEAGFSGSTMSQPGRGGEDGAGDGSAPAAEI